MRVLGSIDGTDKVYNATWAALLVIARHNVLSEQKISRVAVPALGAGFGGVPYLEVSRQMAAAWSLFLNPPCRIDWDWVISPEKAI